MTTQAAKKPSVSRTTRNYARFIMRCAKQPGGVTQTEIERRWQEETGECALGLWKDAIDIAMDTFTANGRMRMRFDREFNRFFHYDR